MKPASFQYCRPDDLEQALAILAEHGEEAAILAGGQSLMPMLNMRLARPAIVLDVNRIEGLDEIAVERGTVRIGALTRFAALARSETVQEYLPLMALALPHVAHAAIRNRGSLGGSLALADPAAEMPAVAVALGAELELVSSVGRRTVPAEDFYRGLYDTARRADEFLLAVRFPRQEPAEASFFDELSRRHGDFAIVGLAGRTSFRDGFFANSQVVFFGCESHARPASALMRCLEGRAWDAETEVLVAEALVDDLNPSASLEAGPAFKLKVAQALTRRALARVASNLPGGH